MMKKLFSCILIASLLMGFFSVPIEAADDYSRYVGTWVVEESGFDETNQIKITQADNSKISFTFSIGELILSKSNVPIVNNEVSIKYFIVPGSNFYDYEIKYDYADKWHQSGTLKIIFGDNGISAVHSTALFDGSFPSQESYTYKMEGFNGISSAITSNPKFLAPIGSPDPSARKIYNAQDLYNIREDLSSSYVLMNDIDISTFNGGEWLPISDFSGIFDGQGNVIKNMSITKGDNKTVGLFGNLLPDSIIKNVGIEKIRVKSTANNVVVGGICGDNQAGMITNCFITGSIYISTDNPKSPINSACVGGICGDNRGGIISNCYNSSSIFSYAEICRVGGICGSISLSGLWNRYGSITNCYNTGLITASTGSLYSSAYAGGICGSTESSSNIENCFNESEVSTYSYSSSSLAPCAGGICGKNLGNVNNCYNRGDIKISSLVEAYAGGICGFHGNSMTGIINCYNMGSVDVVSLDAYTGGICGSSNGIINKNVVLSDSIYAENRNSYYDRTCLISYTKSNNEKNKKDNLALNGISGNAKYDASRNISLAEAKSRSTYEGLGWDFNSIWVISPSINSGYPYLRAFSIIEDIPDQVDNEIKVFLNDKEITFSSSPFTEKNQLLVPIKTLVEAMGVGATLNWDGSTGTVTIIHNRISTKLTKDTNAASILYKREGDRNYTRSVEMDAPMRVINGVSYAPLGFLAKFFNAKIEYDWDKQATCLSTGFASHLQLALFSHMSYWPFDLNNPQTCSNEEFKTDIINSSDYVDIFQKEMNGWNWVPEGSSSSWDGFQVIMYKNDETIVLAFRGTDNWQGWVEHVAAIGSLALFTDNAQTNSLYAYLDSPLVKEYIYNAKRIYITGHSLGGYLSYFATDRLCTNGYGYKIAEVVTFNGQSLNWMREHLPSGKILNGGQLKDKVKITRYIISGDGVGDTFGKILADDLGTPEYFEPTYGGFWDKHSMMNFYLPMKDSKYSTPR